MALLGRRQPFKPIINRQKFLRSPAKAVVVSFAATESPRPRPVAVIFKRLIQFQPIAPTASKPIVISFAANERAKPHAIAHTYIAGLIRYQPIAPTAGRPFVVSFMANERAKPRAVAQTTIHRPIQYQPIAPTAGKPFLVSFAANESHRPKSVATIFNRLLQYQPPSALPIAAKPFIATVARRDSLRRPAFAPIINRLIRYQPTPPARPIARGPVLVTAQSVAEAERRARTVAPRHRLVIVPVEIIPVRVIVPAFKVHHNEAADNSRTRKHEQQVTAILNGLLGTGELTGTSVHPKLGYVCATIQPWGMNPPTTVKEALDRIAAALEALGQIP